MSKSETLYKKLIEYSQGKAYPFHMPGHKRQIMSMEDPYRFDLTEIDGFDNLHEAGDILKTEEERAARLYQSEETHLMVNGSTGGILAGIAGVTRRGDRVLVARNCHTSVYHALELNGLKPVFLWPELNEELGIYYGITREMVEKELEKNPDIRAVIFTSPTYEGILSDVKGICEAVHQRGIPCVVDEAHGAHLRWCQLPDSVSQGADVVIQSLHKTLPALTQTALIHLNGSLISKERVRRMLGTYQTSSPSYVLMASISQCLEWLEQEGAEAFRIYGERVMALWKRLEELKYIHLYIPEVSFDWGKLVISTHLSKLSGRQLYDELRDTYHLQMEMVSSKYVLAMTTVGDSPEGLKRLESALDEMDWFYEMDEMAGALIAMDKEDAPEEDEGKKIEVFLVPEQIVDLAEAVNHPKENISLVESKGRVAGEYIYLYPPGIPMLIPGEVIQMEHIEKMQQYLAQGLEIHGGYDKETESINVLSEMK